MGTNSRKRNKIIGSAYKDLIKLVEKHAHDSEPVLFVGETGTGKELLAQSYMDKSSLEGERKTINCAEFTSESALASELFGHVKGAYTGATQNREGLIKACAGGILFMDELGSAPRNLHAAILRVVEGYPFRQMGSDNDVTCENPVIIAATNDLKSVRHDLKHRFHLLPVPSLQKTDIPEIATHFLRNLQGEKDVFITQEVLRELVGKEYPGNIRELKKACEDLHKSRGQSIFCKKEHREKTSLNFDYSRFKREMETWNQYLQPLVDEYKLDFKYKYLDPEKGVRLKPEMETEGLTEGEIIGRSLEEGPIQSMLYLIENLRNGNHAVKDDFVKNLKLQFKEFELPYLLQILKDTGCRSLKERSELMDQRQPSLSPFDKPQMWHLFDLPRRRAKEEFELAYFEYHNRYKSKAEAAKDCGFTSEKLFNQALNRARKKLQ